MADYWVTKREVWADTGGEDVKEHPEGWEPFAKEGAYLYLRRVERIP